MAFIYMLTSPYSITGPGWHESNAAICGEVPGFCALHHEMEEPGAASRAARAQPARRHPTAHGLCGNTAVPSAWGTWPGTALLARRHQGSERRREAFPARGVFTHSSALKGEFGTAWSAEEYHISAADSQTCPQAKFTRRHTQSEFAFPSDNVPPHTRGISGWCKSAFEWGLCLQPP